MLSSLVALALFGAAYGQGEVVQPKLVIPGEWMVDKNEQFMFLPLTVPTDMPVDQIKIMSNGQSILVVVTEKPKEEPDTNAVRKYKMIVEAIKIEANNDEKILKDKLQTWLETEDDDEVKVHVRSALDSLVKVRAAKDNQAPRTVAIPLGMLAKQAAAAIAGGAVSVKQDAVSFLAKASAHNASASVNASVVAEPEEVKEGEHALASIHTEKKIHVGIIKESFAVEIPYPIPTETVFILRTENNVMMVSMPLKRNSLEAKGISTGGKPFLRVPVFSVTGQQLAGPAGAGLSGMAPGLHVPSVASKVGLKPLP